MGGVIIALFNRRTVTLKPNQAPTESPLNRRKRAIVIGASSGIGAALVRRFCEEGLLVAALARREDSLNELCGAINADFDEARAFVYPHDVADAESIPETLRRIFADLGGVDVVAYVAGVQPSLELDEFDWRKDAAMVRVNLAGALAWLGQAAALFSQSGYGQIVGVTSLAGDRGRVANPGYSSTKAGLDAYLESLRNRLTRRGVHVLTVKPGFVDTVLLANAPRTFGVISPDQAAAGIWKAMQRRRQLVYVPWWWRWIMLAVRLTPSFIFRRLTF